MLFILCKKNSLNYNHFRIIRTKIQKKFKKHIRAYAFKEFCNKNTFPMNFRVCKYHTMLTLFILKIIKTNSKYIYFEK